MNENGWRLESWFKPLLNCVSSLAHWLIHPICGLYKSSLWPNDMGRINICRHPNKANAHLLKEAIPLVLLSSNLDGQLSLFRNELDSLRMPARYAKRCKAGPRNYQDGIQHLDAIANEHNCTTVARGSETYWSRCEKKTACHELSLSDTQCRLLEITCFLRWCVTCKACAISIDRSTLKEAEKNSLFQPWFCSWFCGLVSRRLQYHGSDWY